SPQSFAGNQLRTPRSVVWRLHRIRKATQRADESLPVSRSRGPLFESSSASPCHAAEDRNSAPPHRSSACSKFLTERVRLRGYGRFIRPQSLPIRTKPDLSGRDRRRHDTADVLPLGGQGSSAPRSFEGKELVVQDLAQGISAEAPQGTPLSALRTRRRPDGL